MLLKKAGNMMSKGYLGLRTLVNLTMSYPSSVFGRQISGTNCTAGAAQARTVCIELKGSFNHYSLADVSVGKWEKDW